MPENRFGGCHSEKGRMRQPLSFSAQMDKSHRENWQVCQLYARALWPIMTKVMRRAKGRARSGNV